MVGVGARPGTEEVITPEMKRNWDKHLVPSGGEPPNTRTLRLLNALSSTMDQTQTPIPVPPPVEVNPEPSAPPDSRPSPSSRPTPQLRTMGEAPPIHITMPKPNPQLRQKLKRGSITVDSTIDSKTRIERPPSSTTARRRTANIEHRRAPDTTPSARSRSGRRIPAGSSPPPNRPRVRREPRG